LAIAPKAGYVFEHQLDIGLSDRNFGKVDYKNGIITLSFTYPETTQKVLDVLSKEFIPVSWGERKYMIPANEIIDFCNEINYGLQPRDDEHSSFLLREGDEKKHVEGWPSIPSEYNRYLLAKPVEAKIISVDSTSYRQSIMDWRFIDTTVTLNVGTSNGVFTGMEFHLYEQDQDESAIITKAGLNTSEAKITQCEYEKEPPPAVGWKFSTGDVKRNCPPEE
jgi:hypothetical protein